MGTGVGAGEGWRVGGGVGADEGSGDGREVGSAEGVGVGKFEIVGSGVGDGVGDSDGLRVIATTLTLLLICGKTKDKNKKNYSLDTHIFRFTHE